MIESIHIVNRESGISLFIRSYTKNILNKEIMFVAFLKAMEDLSQETKQESVQEIILKETKIVFYKNDIVVVLAITNKTDDSELTRRILKAIGEKFVEQYKERLEFFSGRVSDFDGFSETVDNIIKNSSNLTFQQSKNNLFSFNPLSILKKIGIL
ncbi:MAG: hypothetical protein ACTSRG_08650 [Candidatus Helarchaeota archaeon]